MLLVGGGIGGMAAALALARLGISIDLLEQSAAIGEIGAGLQLGPQRLRRARCAGRRRGGAARLGVHRPAGDDGRGRLQRGRLGAGGRGLPRALSQSLRGEPSRRPAWRDPRGGQAASADPLPHLGAGRAAGHRRARRDRRDARRPALPGRCHRRLRRRQVGGAQPSSSAMRRASRATWCTAPWCRPPTCPRTCAGTRPWSGPAPTATWCTTRCATASNTTWS